MTCTDKVEKRRLKYLATINDQALGEDTDPALEIHYIDIGNVDSSGEVAELATYRFADAPSRARRLVRDGDVIVSTVRTYLQAIATIKEPPDYLVVSTGFAVVRPDPAVFDAEFCKYALREASFLAEVERRSVGISYPAINSSDLGDIEVYLRPLSKQRAIATFLDKEMSRLDRLKAEKQMLLDLLSEKRRSLITASVTLGLDPRDPLRKTEIPWLGDLPARWPVTRAKFLFRQSSLPVREDDEIVTCFRDGQVTLRRNRREEGFTNAVKELGYQGIREGQLVLHSMDAFAGAIGVSDSNGKCSPEYIICDPQNDSVINNYYGHLLRTMALSGFIQAACPAVRERAPRIRFSDFAEMLLPAPPRDDQTAIVAHIARETAKLDAFRSATQRTIILIKERQTALIAEAITGQIDVGSAA